MTATVQAPVARPTLWSRIGGFGSIFAKTVRDSRRATLITAGALGLIFLGVSYAITSEFSTPESRLEIENLVNAVPPILQGMAGKVVNVGTLGGYLQYKYGLFFPLVVSLWSILALSGTLAAESRRGSMDILAATGLSRRRIALEKVAAHVLMLSLACFVLFVSLVLAGSLFAELPQDELAVEHVHLAAKGFEVQLSTHS